MKTCVAKIVSWTLMAALLLVASGCSQVSLFTLMESEQEGEFDMVVDSLNMKVDSQFKFDSVGGYLPYTYALKEENVGQIDPETGQYTAPDNVTEVTIESFDALGHRDSARVSIYDYESIMADPASFSIRLDDPDQDILLSGGVGPFTATTENENAAVTPVTFSTTPTTVTYSPPPETGTDYVDVVDEQGNSLRIKVDVLPTAGTADLEILPTYAVVDPGGAQTFNITNTTGNSLSIALSDSFGSIDNNAVDAVETSASVVYDAPINDGAVFLTVTDDVTGDSVQADIYVQGEVTPLEITPGNIEVSPGAIVEFTASGGFPPYIFSQLNGTGTLVQTSPTTANYTPESVISMIRVTDGLGSQAKVKIQVK